MAQKWGERRRGVPKNVTLKDEAAAYLVEKCGGVKTQGDYVSILLLAERAREEERERLKAEVSRVVADADKRQAWHELDKRVEQVFAESAP